MDFKLYSVHAEEEPSKCLQCIVPFSSEDALEQGSCVKDTSQNLHGIALNLLYDCIIST